MPLYDRSLPLKKQGLDLVPPAASTFHNAPTLKAEFLAVAVSLTPGSRVNADADAAENMVLAGVLTTSGNPVVVKLDRRGRLLWARQVPDPSAHSLQDTLVDPAGNVYIATRSSLANLFKFSPGGQLLWWRTGDLSGSQINNTDVLACDAGGNVYWSFTSNGSSAIVKLSPGGAPVAQCLLANTGVNGLAIDGNGAVYAGGNGGTGVATVCSQVVKLAAGLSAILWQVCWDFGTGFPTKAMRMRMAPDGNVVVAGTAYIIKASAANGAIIWNTGDNIGSDLSFGSVSPRDGSIYVPINGKYQRYDPNGGLPENWAVNGLGAAPVFAGNKSISPKGLGYFVAALTYTPGPGVFAMRLPELNLGGYHSLAASAGLQSIGLKNIVPGTGSKLTNPVSAGTTNATVSAGTLSLPLVASPAAIPLNVSATVFPL